MHELPMEFYNVWMFEIIGNSLGTFIKANLCAVKEKKMRFARIRIMVDMSRRKRNLFGWGQLVYVD